MNAPDERLRECQAYAALLEERLHDIQDALFLVVRHLGHQGTRGSALLVDAAELPKGRYGVNIDRATAGKLFLIAFEQPPPPQEDP